MGRAQTSTLASTVIVVSVALLAGTTVLWQEQQLGLPYLEGEQFARHQSVLSGSAPNPWRYRVLAEWIAAGFIKAAYVTQVPRPIAVGFLGLRFFQNALIFLLAFMYYRRLDLGTRQALVGVLVLAFAFTYAVDNSDLSLNTYFDVAFYLVAVLFLIANQVLPFLAVVVIAALNRETSAFIPLLPLAEWVAHPRTAPAGTRRLVWISAAGLTLWVSVFGGLRFVLGWPATAWRDDWGPWGWELVAVNLSSAHTWLFLALTFSILPLLTLWEFRLLPIKILGLFWLIVPLWFAIHFASALVNETRLFLVPVALVFIPGALCRRVSSRGEENVAPTPG